MLKLLGLSLPEQADKLIRTGSGATRVMLVGLQQGQYRKVKKRPTRDSVWAFLRYNKYSLVNFRSPPAVIMKIGIPRALLYYHYFPMWKTFFELLGAKVLVSPTTTQAMVVEGSSALIGDICLPVRVFCGHVLSLTGQCDYLFIPAVHSMQPRVHNCPKLIGLPDVIRASIPACPPILDPDVDLNKGPRSLREAANQVARTFTGQRPAIDNALAKAIEAHRHYRKLMRTDGLCPPEAIKCMFPEIGHEVKTERTAGDMTLGIVGHRYVLFDEHVNYRLLTLLREYGVTAVFPEAVSRRKLRDSMTELVDQPYWGYEEEIVGAGGYFMNGEVDGIISVVSFGCGPDSLMIDLIQRAARRHGKPFLNLVLDEHSADGGLVTRLEAFIDMARRSRTRTHRHVYVQQHERQSDGIGILGIPNFGVIAPAFRASARMLNVELKVPTVTKRTVSLGTRFSPEFVCLPFKVITGCFIECLEEGADTLFMVTSPDACRMGYYSKVQEQILRDLGYDFKFLRHTSSDRGLLAALRTVRRFTNHAPWRTVFGAYWLATSKLKVLDDLERKISKVRAIEARKGAADDLRREAFHAVEEVTDLRRLRAVSQRFLRELDRIPVDRTVDPLRVGIVGELYIVAEPFANYNLEIELGKMGVETTRARSTYLSEWTKIARYLRVLNEEKARLAKYAAPYLKRDVGGHGLESVAEKVRLARQGYDGIVHLAPLTCMPEVIAQNILPTTEDKIPVLTILCDEQLTETGVRTRLEAFVDLLHHRRQHRIRPREWSQL